MVIFITGFGILKPRHRGPTGGSPQYLGADIQVLVIHLAKGFFRAAIGPSTGPTAGLTIGSPPGPTTGPASEATSRPIPTDYTICLDNLFTNVPLANVLGEFCIGFMETTSITAWGFL